jgi:hypothetical protein
MEDCFVVDDSDSNGEYDSDEDSEPNEGESIHPDSDEEKFEDDLENAK